MSSPKVEQLNPRELLLRYQVTGPGDNAIGVVRRVRMLHREHETELTEEFSLTPAKVVDYRPGNRAALLAAGPPPHRKPFCRSTTAGRGPARWAARRCAASGSWETCCRMCPRSNSLCPWSRSAKRANGWRPCAPILTSARSMSYRPARGGSPVRSAGAMPARRCRWRQAGRQTRHFGVWLAAAKPDEAFGRSLDAFFRLMLPDVPPGPKWLHEIAMVGYDYLSDGGKGWEKDVQ